MAEVDTSIYRHEPPNPLAGIASVVGTVGGLQNIQLMQQALQIRNNQARQDQANDIRSVIAPHINNPNATRASVIAEAAARARQTQPMPGVLEEAIAPFQDPNVKLKDALNNAAVAATGVPSILSRQQTINPVTLAPTATPSQSLLGRGVATGPAAGAAELAAGPAGAGGITNMAAVANDAPNQRALLENLNDLSSEAISGPSSDFEKRANAFLQRILPGSTGTLTANKLAKSEEYGKITEQLAGQQATAAHATNAFLTNAYSTNPSLYLSKIGRQGITHMLQGNVDSIVAKNNEWNKYANGEIDGQMHSPAEFSTWNRTFNSDFNPRAFQYARMTPEERKSFRSALPEKQQQSFLKSLKDYQAKGWIDLSGQ